MEVPHTGHLLPLCMRKHCPVQLGASDNRYACLFMLVPPDAWQEPCHSVSIADRNFVQSSCVCLVYSEQPLPQPSSEHDYLVNVWVCRPATAGAVTEVDAFGFLVPDCLIWYYPLLILSAHTESWFLMMIVL
jgi:hypothetical protein